MNQGKMTALDRLVTSEYSNIAGLAVLKDGHTLFESFYNGCNAASKIHVFSVTKSIISILIGIARGRWENNQIVSEKWIAESTKEHSRWKANKLPYGYLWWIYQDGFAAMGDGGNTIYVNQQKNIVISIASSFMSRAKDRMELIQKHIEPLV